MCPVHIVVVDEGVEQAAEVVLVQDDDVVEQFTPDGADESLGDPVLPRAPVAGPRRLHLHRTQCRHHPVRERGAAIEDHEPRCRLEWEGITKLLSDPGGGRARRDGAAGYVAPAVADDEEHVDDLERRGRDGEEVHGGDPGAVIPEEGRPSLASLRGARQVAKIARDAALGDLEAEAEQFSVDAGRAPGILRGHPPDESADLAREGRPAGARAPPGQPVPVDAEAGAVPAHDRIRLDDGEGLGPTAPEAAQQDPEDPIGGPDVGMSSTGEGGQLLAEGQILDHEVASGEHGRAEGRQERYEEANHRAGEIPCPWPNRQWFQPGRSYGERQVNFGHGSGVVLDVCREHGAWFDRDELRQVLQFIQGGGFSGAEQRKNAAKRQREFQRFTAALPPTSTQLIGPGEVADAILLAVQVLKNL